MPPKKDPRGASGTGSLTIDGENAVLAHIATWPLQLALVTVIGTDVTPGTEVTGGSYARKAITLGTPVGGTVGHTNTISFTNMPAATVVGGEVWNTSTGKRVMHGLFPAPITALAASTITFGPGDLTFDMD